ncbi:HNH endonuclease [Priestia megaterium]|uniref:HNH endonuclease n=1 Tax=Priestia megaterium TaxID=1404 RepID=UPI0020401CFB|nr:HNH endonuclease [Priestia megaterium]MCM3186374.1 HNH endonuclease [Priestia megaterium]
MTTKEILLENTRYIQIDKITANVPDSFVHEQNKLVTSKSFNKEKPSTGETRLYIGSETIIKQEGFFVNFPNQVNYYGRMRDTLSINSCFFSKDNLLQYLYKAHKEYTKPSQNYFHDININYGHNRAFLSSLEEEYIPFTLFHHDGKEDSERFYINSLDQIWTALRQIALPVISYVNIYKMINEKEEIIYYFELNLHKDYVYLSSNDRIFNTYRKINRDPEITITERKALINARSGQGKFKNNLLQTMFCCPFTQISERNLLRASHIKPWVFSNNVERLDGYNGLLLTPTYDVLFDRGLITFNNDGSLQISSLLSQSTRVKLGVTEGKVYDIANANGERSNYLQYHRKFIFKRNLGMEST